MTINRLKALVKDDFEAVNALILSRLQTQIPLVSDLAQHLLLNGGKRLRPLLVLLASGAAGYKGSNHIVMAAMVEFFHAATLLHDDVVDESTLRHGRETANEIWGSKASILVGDFLYTNSIQLCVSVENWPITRMFSDTSYQLTCGEVKQLANRHNHDLTFEDYFDIIRSKTALLFAVSATIGSLLVESSKEIQEGFYAFGLHLGNAFQLIDDTLDYCAEVQMLGKNPGDDLADGKVTLPLLHALKTGTTAQQTLIKNCLGNRDLTQFTEILDVIHQTQSIAFTRNLAEIEIDKAIKALDVLPESPWKQALIELATYAVQRDY